MIEFMTVCVWGFAGFVATNVEWRPDYKFSKVCSLLNSRCNITTELTLGKKIVTVRGDNYGSGTLFEISESS